MPPSRCHCQRAPTTPAPLPRAVTASAHPHTDTHCPRTSTAPPSSRCHCGAARHAQRKRTGRRLSRKVAHRTVPALHRHGSLPIVPPYGTTEPGPQKFYLVCFTQTRTSGPCAGVCTSRRATGYNPRLRKQRICMESTLLLICETITLFGTRHMSRFVFRTCFGSIISVRARGHCESSRRSTRR